MRRVSQAHSEPLGEAKEWAVRESDSKASAFGITRSLFNVTIPVELLEVTVRGRDSVHQLGGIEMILSVPTQ